MERLLSIGETHNAQKKRKIGRLLSEHSKWFIEPGKQQDWYFQQGVEWYRVRSDGCERPKAPKGKPSSQKRSDSKSNTDKWLEPVYISDTWLVSVIIALSGILVTTMAAIIYLAYHVLTS